MKKQSVILFLLLILHCIGAAAATKTTIVAENTINIPSKSDKEFYYGFAKGDKITIDLNVENEERISLFEVTELPFNQRFMDYYCGRIRSKEITVEQSGIFKFKISNTAAVSKTCKLTIKRSYNPENNPNFNATVYWRAQQDTTYKAVSEKYIAKSDTLIHEIYSGSPQIAARYAINGSNNYQIIHFTLPENTIRWSFYIGTGTEGKEVFDKAKTNFALNTASVISHIPEYGPMAALALTGVSYFSGMQGEDNVKYWFLKDLYNVQQFIDNKSYDFYKKGDVITEACQMRSPLKGRVYLAVMNDNSVESILLTIKVTAIEVKQQWKTRIVQRMTVTNKNEPYLKE